MLTADVGDGWKADVQGDRPLRIEMEKPKTVARQAVQYGSDAFRPQGVSLSARVDDVQLSK